MKQIYKYNGAFPWVSKFEIHVRKITLNDILELKLKLFIACKNKDFFANSIFSPGTFSWKRSVLVHACKQKNVHYCTLLLLFFC